MAEPQTQADPTAVAIARARLRGKRIALGIVITVVVVYIAANAVDIIPAVFGAVRHPLPAAPPGTPAHACAEGLRRLASTDDPGGDDQIRPSCAASSEGLDAWAALERLRSGQRQLAGRSGSEQELETLRQQVLAHLPAELR